MLFLLYAIFLWLSTCSTCHFLPNFAFISKSDKSFFNWAWGAESTVAVVDRSPAVSFSSRPAAFGAEISSAILGYVIPLSSFTAKCNTTDPLYGFPANWGCPKLCTVGPHEPESTESWIALVQRGECEFVHKVREAQRLGARAVVVGGVDPTTTGLPDSLITMYSPDDSSDINIAATFIKYVDYMHLISLIATSNTSHSGLLTLSLLITAEYSAWEWYSPIITFVVILLLPSILTFATLLIHRMRASRAAQRDRAPEDVVRNLPCVVWTGKGWEKHEGGEGVIHSTGTTPEVDLELGLAPQSPTEPVPSGDEDDVNASTSQQHDEEELALALKQPWFEGQDECAICLTEFAKGDKVRVLPCFHIFHMEEVDEWLIQRKKLCPICKADVTLGRHPVTDAQNLDDPPATTPEPAVEISPPNDNEQTPLLPSSRQSSYTS